MIIKIAALIVFLGWVVFGIILTTKTNKKYKALLTDKDSISEQEFKKRKSQLRSKHMLKVFVGLLVCFILFMCLVYINVNYLLE